VSGFKPLPSGCGCGCACGVGKNVCCGGARARGGGGVTLTLSYVRLDAPLLSEHTQTHTHTHTHSPFHPSSSAGRCNRLRLLPLGRDHRIGVQGRERTTVDPNRQGNENRSAFTQRYTRHTHGTQHTAYQTTLPDNTTTQRTRILRRIHQWWCSFAYVGRLGRYLRLTQVPPPLLLSPPSPPPLPTP
jgi:hypothetical protein